MAGEDLRKYRLKMKPRPGQIKALDRALYLHRLLYNAALEEREITYRRDKETHDWIRSWKDHAARLGKAGDEEGAARFRTRIEEARKKVKNFSQYSQNYALKPICRDNTDYAQLSSSSLALTLKRVHEAYQHFFRRVKESREKPGFPRYKGRHYFNSFDLKAPQKKKAGSAFSWPGWKIDIAPSGRSGRLYIKGITPRGTAIPLRGRLKYPPALCAQDLNDPCKAPVKNATVRREGTGWELTITLDCAGLIARQTQGAPVAFDWGARRESFLTTHDGRRVENPKYLHAGKKKIRRRQRALSRKEGRGRNRRQARGALARTHAKVARQRREFLHEQSARLVAGAGGFVATEKLNLRNMTKSGRGTKEKPGRKVKQKAGLNRSILDSSPGKFLQLVAYKAKEAGLDYIEIDPRRHRPSQTCPECGAVRKKTLAERRHICAQCGYEADRDQAAAQVIMKTAEQEREGRK